MRRWTVAAALAASVVIVSGCGSGDDDAEPSPGLPTTMTSTTPTTPATGVGTPRLDGVVATGLDAPWGLAFLPDGGALVSQRDEGTVVHVAPDGTIEDAGAVDGVEPGGEGGLLGIALSPDYRRDRYVYAYYTADQDNRIVRMRYEGGRLGAQDVVLAGIPKAGNHNGGRIVFGPDGMLYVGTGDAGDRARAQDRDSLGGKILRLTPDGGVPPGNPFPGSPVWSYGHRNVQGLAFDADGRLWASEFGQDRWDELNLIQPGRNYGWPEVEGAGGGDGFTDPLATWRPEEASPSGIAVVDGAVYLAALRGGRLWQVPVSDGRVGTPRDVFTGELGRLRTVEPAPDGTLWLVTSNTDGRGDPREDDDRILRVTLR